jgi:hypothetical protein
MTVPSDIRRVHSQMWRVRHPMGSSRVTGRGERSVTGIVITEGMHTRRAQTRGKTEFPSGEMPGPTATSAVRFHAHLGRQVKLRGNDDEVHRDFTNARRHAACFGKR